MRVSFSTKRRLERLEINLSVGRPIALWPPTLSFDEWEAIALPSQNKLFQESADENKANTYT